jgi:hypothetical protein
MTIDSCTTLRRLAGLGLMAVAMLPIHAAQESELKDDAGKTIIKYVVEAPSGIAAAGVTDPARQVGLILCSQEHDTPTGNDLFPVRQSLLRQGLLDRYVLIAPAPQGRKFGPADHEPIEKLIGWAMKTYPINPRRVYMYGKGEGSKISMEFMMTHPRLITAAIGYSWGAWLMPSELKESLDFANSAPEIYLTLGRRDLANHLSCVRDAYLRLREKGYHFIYREFDELGDRTYHPTSNDDALAWATRLRNKSIAPSPEEAKLLKTFGGNAPAPIDGYYPALALVGGAPAGAVVQKLFGSKDPAVRAAAAETCRHAIFDEATTAALTKLLSDSSVKVRQSTIRALAMYANWRYAPAQRALVDLATNRAADPLDRLSATDAIGYAVRLQVKGVRQDPPLFQALVSLLQEKEEPIRATAAGILAPIYEHTGEGGQRRRSPEGGWEKWLNEIVAPHAVTLTAPGTDLASLFRNTLQAAEKGDGAAQAAVAMMYANGKGVQQSYAEAGKWWIKAAEGGDLKAARHAWNLYRNGEGVDRNPTIANQWAKVIGEPIQVPRVTGAAPAKK